MTGKLPDALVACVGGGSNAIGLFYPFIDDPSVRLIGVEAAGDGIATGRHSAPLNAGRPGVLHGNRTYLMADDDGEIIETHSISAGLDYPGVGPEHAWLKDTGRAEYVSITDDEALEGFYALTKMEGIIPALESSHAMAHVMRLAPTMRKRKASSSICRDVATRTCRRWQNAKGSCYEPFSQHFERLAQSGRKALIPFITAGDPYPEFTLPLLHEMVKAGVDVIELGVPFSDPMADGPVIQRASERALAHKMSLTKTLAIAAEFRKTNQTTPIVLMGYLNPIEAMGYEGFANAAQRADIDGVLTVDLPPEEGEDCAAMLKQRNIDTIFLLAPNSSDERIQKMAAIGSGYLYYVSLKGVTGAGHWMSPTSSKNSNRSRPSPKCQSVSALV